MRRLLFLLALVVCSQSAQAQNIGIFFDLSGATCSGNIPAGQTGRAYIIAVPGGDAAGGITGAEFRVVGLPAGWVATSVRNPLANVQVGDPFNGVGVNLAFPVCQSTPTVLLFTVDIVATTALSDVYLRIAQRNPALNPNFRCPLVTRCESPAFAIVCTTGGQAIVNPTGPGCTVATTPTSWTGVKALYDQP